MQLWLLTQSNYIDSVVVYGHESCTPTLVLQFTTQFLVTTIYRGWETLSQTDNLAPFSDNNKDAPVISELHGVDADGIYCQEGCTIA